MAKYTYPTSELDNAGKLLSTIGSYWATTYLGMDFLSDVLKAKANLTAQTWVNFMELIASISRFTVPVFHHENWYPVVVKESELNNFDFDTIKSIWLGLCFFSISLILFFCTHRILIFLQVLAIS